MKKIRIKKLSLPLPKSINIYCFIVILLEIAIYLKFRNNNTLFLLVILLELLFLILFLNQSRKIKDLNQNLEDFFREYDSKIEILKGDYLENKKKIQKLCILNNEDILEIDIQNYKDKIVIGKENNFTKVDIDLTYHEYSLLISKVHTILYKVDEYWYIEDTFSKNGVYIERDGERIKVVPGNKTPIYKDDLIYLSMVKIFLK